MNQRANPNGGRPVYRWVDVKRIIFVRSELVAYKVLVVVMPTVERHKTVTEPISVLVIEPSREMQRLLRAMLSNFGIRDVQIFSDSGRATNSLLSSPPSIVLMDWEAAPYDGPSFLKLVRHENMYPVCLVPIIIMVSEARQKYVERALRLGAHAVVAKPMAPSLLVKRINWVLAGHQKLRLQGDHYVIDGAEERLAVERERESQLRNARAYQESQFAEMMDIQNDVDRLLNSSF